MKLSKKQREELRMKFGGRCAYCGCELPEKGWHADHVEATLRKWHFGERKANGTRAIIYTGDHWKPENDVLDNLFPACAPCNLFKATFSVEVFREQIAEQAERARQYSVNFRTAERFGQVQITRSPIVFWFEKYQREDAA
ncbi:HNH endonuclease [Pectobacterium carotovorum]|uniref:HNH endonuclease n=1 Tax=Pectobacterium carotovorum TaxID=554 RepID=UPI00191E12F9|nr:HNH endonuclease [Pectobacterium carotovorum]MBL0907835.1 HNH endonuclease [Pectobacterium carotovorum]